MELLPRFSPRKVARTETGIEIRTDRGSDVSEKKKNHQRCEAKADRALVDNIFDCQLDECRLVEDHVRLEDGWNIEQVRNGLLDSIDDGDRVRIAALLQDGNVDGVLPVDTHDVGLELSTVLCLSDIADHHRGIADGFQRKIVDLVHDGNLTIGIDVVVLHANANIAGGKNQIGLVERIHHIHDAHLVSFQPHRIDVHHDLAIASAIGLRNGCPRNIGDLIANGKLRQILERGFIQPLPLKRNQAHRQIGCIEL